MSDSTPTVGTIAQVGFHETVTYTMPRQTYDYVAAVLEWGSLMARPKMTVERALNLLARILPDIHEGITVTREPSRPAICGAEPNVLIIDGPVASTSLSQYVAKHFSQIKNADLDEIMSWGQAGRDYNP